MGITTEILRFLLIWRLCLKSKKHLNLSNILVFVILIWDVICNIYISEKYPNLEFYTTYKTPATMGTFLCITTTLIICLPIYSLILLFSKKSIINKNFKNINTQIFRISCFFLILLCFYILVLFLSAKNFTMTGIPDDFIVFSQKSSILVIPIIIFTYCVYLVRIIYDKKHK